jgi:hypothetical protein
MTWDELVAAEPRLGALEAAAQEIARRSAEKQHWCAHEAFYRHLKIEIVNTIGGDRNHTHPDPRVEHMLRSEGAYRLAHDYLYELLPACRHGGECMLRW